MICIRACFSRIMQTPNILKPLKYSINRELRFHNRIRCFSSQINTEEYTESIVRQLSNGDTDVEKKLRILMLEVEVMRQDGRPAPDFLNADQWQQLLKCYTRNQRSQYLLYLFKVEKAKQNTKAKKESRRKEFEENPLVIEKENEDDLLYGLQHQSLFLRIRDQSINNMDNAKALQAMMHGQSVVIDCSYEEHMVHREAINSAKQMTFVFGDNRLHKNPFNLHLCNVNMAGPFMKQMRKNIPSLEEPWFPLNIHQESYLDLFPKDKLVYLTPHCREELTNYDHDAIYIIGCMVDKVNNQPLSLAKAKRDGIKMAKLPLDRYLEWAPGAKKNLNINHMVPILLDLKASGDWEHSLRHIPRRKLMETKILAMQKRFKKSVSPDLQDVFKDFKMPAKVNKNVFNNGKIKIRRSLFDE